ncbi:MAG: sulfotransferase [bacterium]|nr:hypothetical protein [Deltaproteobacteria bacterium]MCP4905348.1 sulfotransferase [bacterium]
MKLVDPPCYADFEGALCEAARDSTGFSDFGGEDHLPGLHRLISAYEADLGKDTSTRAACFAMTLPGLVGRLHSQRGWTETPECLDQPIVRPLVITGIPRTGTTALHQLLAMDPQFQGLERWIIPNPIVRPTRESWNAHPHYQTAARAVAALAESSPRAMAVHGIAADDVDECLALMMQSFVTNQIPSLLDLPTYDEWFLAQDEASSYDRLADNLRLIGNGDRGKTWLLKNPTHLLRMKTLLAVFPDARIIHTHRKLVPALVSMCGMLGAFRGDPRPGSPEARAIGPRQVRVYKQATEHAMAVREAHPNAFHDVYQEVLLTDPMSVIDEIYERFELDLRPETESKMQRWLVEHPAPAPDERRKRPEDFGLTEREILDAFDPYIERYGLS